MKYFRAYKAKAEILKVPTYFIESTAPDNVDDSKSFDDANDEIPRELVDHLKYVKKSDDAVKEIAGFLAHGTNPNLVVMVHGFNNPKPDVLRTYAAAALAINGDHEICKRDSGLVCLGYRWPSEKMGQPRVFTWVALPILPTWILGSGIAFATLPFLLYYLAQFRSHPILDHVMTLLGLFLAGLVITAAALRLIVYFRDNYRASNYGIPDLIQIIRAIEEEVKILRHPRYESKEHQNDIQLSFIGHSMGAFVVTNTIRTLSDVFATPVKSLNAFGVAGPTPDFRLQNIGKVFKLKRFVLASPDIPAEALLSNRGNFLASTLSRFEEAYLFSSEGDEVLRQISTLANYFVFPTKSRNYGFRLGNVEILSKNYGLIDPNEAGGFLKTLRIGNLTLQALYAALDKAEADRQPKEERPARTKMSLPEVFTYFDCTDYVEEDAKGRETGLLTFAKRQKRHCKTAKLPLYSHLRLLLAYLFIHKPNVHGGYFEGQLSQELIYRLACLGFDETIKAYDSEVALGEKCEKKQIRVLISPCLREPRTGPAAAMIRRA